MVSATRCYKIGPGEDLKRKELGRGRGLLVKSAAEFVSKGQWRKQRMKMMRLKTASIGGRTPSAESLKMASTPQQQEKLNGPLLDDGAVDAKPPLKWENASSSIGEDFQL